MNERKWHCFKIVIIEKEQNLKVKEMDIALKLSRDRVQEVDTIKHYSHSVKSKYLKTIFYQRVNTSSLLFVFSIDILDN